MKTPKGLVWKSAGTAFGLCLAASVFADHQRSSYDGRTSNCDEMSLSKEARVTERSAHDFVTETDHHALADSPRHTGTARGGAIDLTRNLKPRFIEGDSILFIFNRGADDDPAAGSQDMRHYGDETARGGSSLHSSSSVVSGSSSENRGTVGAPVSPTEGQRLEVQRERALDINRELTLQSAQRGIGTDQPNRDRLLDRDAQRNEVLVTTEDLKEKAGADLNAESENRVNAAETVIAPEKSVSTDEKADSTVNNVHDILVAKQIRTAIMDDSSLSADAQNVQILAANGMVTLRGTVASQAEKDQLEAKAKQIAGVIRVDNQLEVKQ